MKISVLQSIAAALASGAFERQPMKTSLLLRSYARLVTLVVLLPGGLAHGQNLDTLAGRWNGINFDVPARLVLDKNPQGKVVNVQWREHFEVARNQLEVAANGTFTGTGDGDPFAGTFAFGPQGVVEASVPGQPVISFRVNASHDLLAVAYAPENSHELLVLLRAPSALTVAELAGEWHLQQFQTPAELVQVQQPPSGFVTDVQGGSNFGVFVGTLTINTDGTLSGIAGGDPFTGTLAVTGPGEVTASINDVEGTFSIVLAVNANKDLLLGADETFDQDDNYQELIFMTRPPTTVAPADLAGAWKVNYFYTPAALTLQRDQQGVVTEIPAKDEFEVGQQTLTAGNDRFFTGLLGEPVTGAFTIGSQGSVNVTFTNRLGEVSSANLKLNAAKDTMMAVNASEGQEAIVLTKAPAVAGAQQDFGLLVFGNGVFWAAGSNRKLRASGQLPGGFEDVPGTAGLHEFSLPQNPTGSTFFQVVE